jgi:hypothetical protein
MARVDARPLCARAQAEDRAHRIGQAHSHVSVHFLQVGAGALGRLCVQVEARLGRPRTCFAAVGPIAARAPATHW